MTIQWFIVTSLVGIIVGLAVIYGITLIATYLHDRSAISAPVRNQSVTETEEHLHLLSLQYIGELQDEIHGVVERVNKIEDNYLTTQGNEKIERPVIDREKGRDTARQPEPA